MDHCFVKLQTHKAYVRSNSIEFWSQLKPSTAVETVTAEPEDRMGMSSAFAAYFGLQFSPFQIESNLKIDAVAGTHTHTYTHMNVTSKCCIISIAHCNEM